jgi:citrate lyase subunit beta/citryl-CoA lyase
MDQRCILHFVPYASDAMLGKALKLKADCLVLDVEDSVTPDNKKSAREKITQWLKNVDFRGRERTIRMNGFDTPWAREDVEVTMAGRPDGYLVPKCGSKEELLEMDSMLTRLESKYGYPQGSTKLFAIAETAKSSVNMRDFPSCPRVVGICAAREQLDMAAAIGAWRIRDDNGEPLELYRVHSILALLAAHAGDVQAFAGILLLDDLPRMKRELRESAEMGFNGWITVHPSHIDAVHEMCFPPAELVRESEQLIAAFEENRKVGIWAFRFKGQMVDVPNLRRAEKIVLRARYHEELLKRLK